ncbi:hypothetical protein V2J09_021173 [Rumex salicifolius]
MTTIPQTCSHRRISLPTTTQPLLPSASKSGLPVSKTLLPQHPKLLSSSSRPLLSLRCSSVPAAAVLEPCSSSAPHKPFPAELSRTIMELCSVGTLSTLSHDGWPLGIGVRFAVDSDGTPLLCLNASNRILSLDKRSTLHVQLMQCGVRTPQCTIQGSLDKPADVTNLKKLLSLWKKKFGEIMNEDLVYALSVDRILQLEDFQEDGIWVTSSNYKNAKPDPLRESAERIVNEINTNNMEDVLRFSRIYADLNFQVCKAQMVWIDRLGFDMRLYSPENAIFEVRIPFLREVADEKGVKSLFNGMSQIAWEVEKNYYAPDFDRVRQFKQIA